MVGTSPKKAKNPVYNEPFCRILYALMYNEENAPGLAKLMSKSHKVVYRQLQDLETRGWIKPSKTKRGAYRPYWPRITEAFLDFVIEQIDYRLTLEIKHTSLNPRLDNYFDKKIAEIGGKKWKKSDTLDRQDLLSFKQLLQDSKYRMKCIENKFLNNTFKTLFGIHLTGGKNVDMMAKVFYLIIYKSWLTKLIDSILNNYSFTKAMVEPVGYIDEPPVRWTLTKPQKRALLKKMGNLKYSQFNFFIDFSYKLDGSVNIMWDYRGIATDPDLLAEEVLYFVDQPLSCSLYVPDEKAGHGLLLRGFDWDTIIRTAKKGHIRRKKQKK